MSNKRINKNRNIPNETTLKAFIEIEEMEKNPDNYKRYSNVQELLEDLKK